MNITDKINGPTSASKNSNDPGHQMNNNDNSSLQTSCSYYSLTSASSSTSSSSTSCDSCSMNIALDANIEYYNHSYNESADHHSFIGRLMSTINMETNKKFDEDEDDNDEIRIGSFDEECVTRVFHKIESLLMSKYPDHWEMLDYLFRDEQCSIEKAERFITSECLCEYVCLLQQLFQCSSSSTADDQRDQQEIRHRIGLFCRKLMAKNPAIVSMFIPQLASLLKASDMDDNAAASGVGPNLHFSNVIKTNLFYSDSNRVEVPIADKDLFQLIDWLHPGYNLPQLFQFIETTRVVLKEDLNHLFKNKGSYYLSHNHLARTDPFSQQHTMPIMDHLLIFILNENHPLKQKSTSQNSSSDSLHIQVNKNLIVFCLRATIFEQALQSFNHWLQQFNENIDIFGDKQSSIIGQHNPSLTTTTDDRKANTNDSSRLWSSYLVSQLYRLAIDLAMLCSSFNHLDLVNQFLSLRVADLDLTSNLERAMKAINFELNDENGGLFNEHNYIPAGQTLLLERIANHIQPQIMIDQYDSYDSFDQSMNNVYDDDDDDSTSSDTNPQFQNPDSGDTNSNMDLQTMMVIKRKLLEKIRMNGQRLEAPVNNRWLFNECCICCENRWLLKRICCSSGACLSCLTRYYTERIRMGQLSIECIGPGCKSLIYRAEVLARLNGDDKALYGRLLLSQSNESDRIRPCPRCNRLFTLSSKQQTKMKYTDTHLLFKRMLMCGLAARLSVKHSKSFKVKCDACHYDWCFKCHSPWHEGISCNDYIRGDRLLKTWAKHSDLLTGDVNAQKCPKCKIYIQRINGCDHMHCIRCKSDFCYRCGDPIRHVRFFGDHYSRLSVFGCKYRYKPKNPVQRKLVRGAVLGSKLVVLPVLTTVCLCTGILVLAVGVAAMPFVGGIYFFNYIRNQRHRTMVHLYNYRINRQDGHVQNQNQSSHQSTIAVINDGNQSIPSFDLYEQDSLAAINVLEWQSMYSLDENVSSNNNDNTTND